MKTKEIQTFAVSCICKFANEFGEFRAFGVLGREKAQPTKHQLANVSLKRILASSNCPTHVTAIVLIVSMHMLDCLSTVFHEIAMCSDEIRHMRHLKCK